MVIIASPENNPLKHLYLIEELLPAERAVLTFVEALLDKRGLEHAS